MEWTNKVIKFQTHPGISSDHLRSYGASITFLGEWKKAGREGGTWESREPWWCCPLSQQSQVFTKGDGKWELTPGNNTKSLRSWFFLCSFIHLVHVAQEIRTLWTERPSFVNPTAAIFPTALPALNAFKHPSVSYKSLNGRRKQQQQPPGQLSAA